jgi:hypothetical protein
MTDSLKLKTYFQNYTVYDATTKSIDDILKITEICIKSPKILVYIKRTDDNELYFLLNESGYNCPINIIFMNKDNLYFYDLMNNSDIGRIVMSVKRQLNEDILCVICEDDDCEVFMSCSKCGSFTCGNCFGKLHDIICPICRGDNFIPFKN